MPRRGAIHFLWNLSTDASVQRAAYASVVVMSRLLQGQELVTCRTPGQSLEPRGVFAYRIGEGFAQEPSDKRFEPKKVPFRGCEARREAKRRVHITSRRLEFNLREVGEQASNSLVAKAEVVVKRAICMVWPHVGDVPHYESAGREDSVDLLDRNPWLGDVLEHRHGEDAVNEPASNREVFYVPYRGWPKLRLDV